MKNNRVRLVRSNGKDVSLVKSRNRLIRLYNAHRENRGWRAVQDELGVKNVATVYNFAMHGIEPKNLEERKKLGLKKKCPTCKRSIKENGRSHVHKDEPEFMKLWKKIEKKTRWQIIIEGLRNHGVT